MDLKSTYNKIADDWHDDHKNENYWLGATDKFISFLKPGGLILDVGCGPGLKTKYFIEKGFKVVGVDFSEKMIEIAKKEAPQGKFFVLDVKNVTDLKESFDGIYAHAVLLHIQKKEIENVLRDLTDNLKYKGYIYIAVKEQRPNQPDEEIKTENNYGYKYKRFYSYFTFEELDNYLKDLKIKIRYRDFTVFRNTRWIEVIGQKIIKTLEK